MKIADRLDRGFLMYQKEFEEKALEVLRSGWYVLGKEVQAFEEEFAQHLGAQFCVGLASGLDALYLGMRALGITTGDEVIVQAKLRIFRVAAVPCGGDVSKGSCVIMLLNDNHLSNVQTLQSVYTQDCPDMLLIACNDCTNNFQSERFLYNFQDSRPLNIRGIYYYESQYPQGEFWVQKNFWSKVDADYVIMLHSGERLVSNSVLRNCIEILNRDCTLAGVACGEELWSNDMKKQIKVTAPLSNEHIMEFQRGASSMQDEIRDSMLVYRLSVLRDLDISISPESTHISRILVPVLVFSNSRICN